MRLFCRITTSQRSKTHRSARHTNLEKPPPRGLEPLLPDSQPTAPSRVTQEPENVLAPSLALSVQNNLGLAAIVAAWPELPEVVKAGIVAMVRAAIDDETARECE